MLFRNHLQYYEIELFSKTLVFFRNNKRLTLNGSSHISAPIPITTQNDISQIHFIIIYIFFYTIRMNRFGDEGIRF